MSCCCSSIDNAANGQFSEKRARKDLAKYRTKRPDVMRTQLVDVS